MKNLELQFDFLNNVLYVSENIISQDANTLFTVSTKPETGDMINGASSIVIGSQSLHKAYWIIHGGTNSWVDIKIS